MSNPYSNSSFDYSKLGSKVQPPPQDKIQTRLSVNKRKEKCEDGVELEITEIKSKKIKLEVDEEEGSFFEKQSEFFFRGTSIFSKNLTSIFLLRTNFKILLIWHDYVVVCYKL